MTSFYPQQWTAYLDIMRVFLRLLGLFVVVPAFSHKAIPTVVKVSLALALSLAFYSFLKPYLGAVPMTLGGLALVALRETVVGLLMGFTAYLVFEAVHLAGQFIGYQIGFGSVGLIDPVNNTQSSVLVPLTGWMALMVFFIMDLHHLMIQLFIYSFKITQNMDLALVGSASVFKVLSETTGNLFVVAVQMAAPITLLALTVNMTVGILSRLLPQMHVILFAFPLTILLGLCTLYVVAPEYLAAMESILGETGDRVVAVLRAL